MIIIYILFWGSFWTLIIDRYTQYLDILKNKNTITVTSYQRLNRFFLKKAFLSRSRCGTCASVIPWYLNMPVISFLILKGRAHCCQKKIPKHLLVYEGCFLVVGLVNHYFVADPYIQIALLFAFSLLILIGILDWQFMLIPDSLSYLLLWLGLLFNLLFDQAFLLQSMMGVVFAYLVLKLLQIFYSYVLNKNALGDADPLLAAAIGAWIGVDWLPYFFLGASSLGILIIISFRKKDDWALKPLPFGPSLAVIGYGLTSYRFVS